MPIRIFLLVFISILAFSNISFAEQSEQSGFNEVCQIYTEAMNSNMPTEEMSKYIFDNISNRVNSKDALIAHDVVFQTAPEKRYGLFKEAAEHSLKSKWDCAAMNKLMK